MKRLRQARRLMAMRRPRMFAFREDYVLHLDRSEWGASNSSLLK